MSKVIDHALLKIIGSRMREARELAGFSQIRAAKLMGYSNSSRLNKIECASDVRSIPVSTIIKASKIYDVSADYLLGCSDDWEREAKVAQCRDISKYLMEIWDSSRRKELNAMRTLNNRLDSICKAVALYEKSAAECSQAIGKFSQLNPDFEDMRGGASVVGSIQRASDSVLYASNLLRRFKADAALWGDKDAMQCRIFSNGPTE